MELWVAVVSVLQQEQSNEQTGCDKCSPRIYSCRETLTLDSKSPKRYLLIEFRSLILLVRIAEAMLQ